MIDMSKTYKTRGGFPVRILCTDYRNSRGDTVIGIVRNPDGSQLLFTWRSNGSYLAGESDSNFDLVEASSYADWPIDAPIWVRDFCDWYPRHFAGVDDGGNPLSWMNGQTSFTNRDRETIAWKEARLASEFTP